MCIRDSVRIDREHHVRRALAQPANDGNEAAQFLVCGDRRITGAGRFGADVDDVGAALGERESVTHGVVRKLSLIHI